MSPGIRPKPSCSAHPNILAAGVCARCRYRQNKRGGRPPVRARHLSRADSCAVAEQAICPPRSTRSAALLQNPP